VGACADTHGTAGNILRQSKVIRECGHYGAVLNALGVGPGARVIAQLEKSAEALLLYIACLRIGAVYVPLNTAYLDKELRHFVEDTKPALIVCEAARMAVFSELHKGRPVRTLSATTRATSNVMLHALPSPIVTGCSSRTISLS